VTSLLEVRDLCARFATDGGEFAAADGVRFDVPDGRTLAIIDESACGKTVTALSIMGLTRQPPAPCWGSMFNTAKNVVDQAPWMAIWPGPAIFGLVLAWNLPGDGLRDALDPRQR